MLVAAGCEEHVNSVRKVLLSVAVTSLTSCLKAMACSVKDAADLQRVANSIAKFVTSAQVHGQDR